MTKTFSNWREFGDYVSESLVNAQAGQANPVGTISVDQITPTIFRVNIQMDLIVPQYEAQSQDIPF